MKYFLVSLYLILNLFISIAISAQPLHFALLSARDSQDAFWGPVEDFAQQAAKQLDIKLSILYIKDSKRNMFNLLAKAKELNVDAVIFPNLGQIALQLIKEAEQQQLPVFLYNSDITEKNKPLAGNPQQIYKYWLASLMPDDRQAGYLLGKYLIEQARLKNFADKNGSVQIIAINGSIADTPARQRLAGLRRAVKEDGNSNLIRSVHAYWLQKTAYYKAFRLSQRYPDTKVYWAASDLMAIGVEQALSEHGLIQGKDYLTGGVDWSQEGLTAVKENQISTSAGGHFMDGAWAVIMLYDHFNGSSLNADYFYLYQSPMSLISSADIDLLLPRLESHNWQDINFRLRSKVLNKHLKEYDFSPASVLEELRKTQAL
ncbi:ABC transporter substrate-binding protein [Psychromonas aquimarina]|uniref:ABC transporter substrate-binding protein n=1 Tax=Psychromonas aquimarina TaxID=444919 RepID=UPI00041BE78B|nr:ABC transporter substrate-binding protein [Psychromonas aquimarina]